MNKSEVYDYLNSLNIGYEITEHEAVFNMEEMSAVDLPYPEAEAKNLFVRDDKKRNYYLITVKGDKKVNLKDFKRANNTRTLSFASADDLKSIMGLIPGAVTPLGILNDKEHRVQAFLDRAFLDKPGLIGIHPNENTATVWLKTEDLMKIIKEHENTLHLVEI
ncbi:prolyl-tRNA editing protein [Blautia sp. An249]|uniref:prolyl-tRNA synthetase associated domain-containing protein n=1 Tax=Blautia sp. An249 TaxID=1965603 RepID=UPI000B38D897|nr:prolyl-tRNA synthetase associated domain-containing protein [Blautia sp. An249]OUO81345.1 prolyl-tRNA editing protein [Blautia sp. An249]